jgi:putative oxidoreductase
MTHLAAFQRQSPSDHSSDSHSANMNTTILDRLRSAYAALIYFASKLQSPLLHAIRLDWGGQFAQTGWGKLMHLPDTTEFFTSLGLPFPGLNAALAGSTECFGGTLLLLGLGSRLVAIPLIFTMIVAYSTADKEAAQAIFSDPDKFTAATPFLFLFACLIVLAFGPGKASLDYLLERRLAPKHGSAAR